MDRFTDSNTRPANAPRIGILKEYGGEVKCYPDLRKYLTFLAKMDHGTIETVYIEPLEILEGAKSSDIWKRDRTRQAKHILSSAEWSSLEDRYKRNQITM
jgi:hypothetical protein